jgi:hypothetical protein
MNWLTMLGMLEIHSHSPADSYADTPSDSTDDIYLNIILF